MPNRSDNDIPPESLERRHEVRDAHLRLVWFGLGLVVLMVGASLAIVGLLSGVFARARPDVSPRMVGSILAPSDQPLRRFAEPQLQIIPHDDLVALQGREEQELTHYGWVNRTAGVVRIPIERAMTLMLERGLPVRSGNAPPRLGPSREELIRRRTETK